MSLKKQAIIVAGVSAGILGLVFYRGGAGPMLTKTAPPPATLGQTTPSAAPIYPPADTPAQAAAPAPNPAAAPRAPAATTPSPDPQPRTMTNVGDRPKPPPWIMSYSGARAAGGGSAGHGGEAPPGASAGGSETGKSTRVEFRPAALPGQKAGRAIDQYRTLMPQPIHCTLDMAIDTTQPGPVFCHLPSPAYSPRGGIMMDRDTMVIAEYKPMQRGQDRVFALAGTAWTPKGVPVPLNFPIADGLGRAGVPGVVDNHTGDRFGGALMLMAAQSAFGALQNLTRQGNNNSSVQLNTSPAENIIGDVLRSTINIPPTLTKAQGEDIVIMTTMPIDFTDVYDLVPR
jgi:type IV secretion system protein VirB10